MASTGASGAQTDHGRLYFDTPREVLAPTSTEELAAMLKDLNARGERVTVRNTGHSTNGQTLTSGVQVSLGGIRPLRFDEQRLEVLTGAGNSWDDVITAVQFPRYCTPLFPNNPGQKIHIGGTAAVGGVGYYGSRVGGFWNHVTSLKLVTMTGEIIECSPARESEIFRYALGGFGRTGVISEFTVRVVPSRPDVMAVALAYAKDDVFAEDFERALVDPELDGVIAQEDLSGWEQALLGALGVHLKLLVVLAELREGEDPQVRADAIRSRYREDIEIFIKFGGLLHGLEPSLRLRKFPKRDLVYFTPVDEPGPLRRLLAWLRRLFGLAPAAEPDLVRPWTDCIVDGAHYAAFMRDAKNLLITRDMARWLEKESFLRGLVNMDSFVTFGIKRLSTGPHDSFPLCLDLPQEPGHARGVAIMPDVPRDQREAALRFSREMTELVYAHGGKRYLYGTHSLTREQVEKQYGRDVLETWQRLKDRLDPRHLLNTGVVPHLDD